MCEIYYLLDFHKKCFRISKYSDVIIENYCKFVNLMLNNNFNIEEQKQLKLYEFDEMLLHEFAYDAIEGITFDNLDKNKLHNVFYEICFVDEDTL